MSSSLKERLRRLSRSHSPSTFSPCNSPMKSHFPGMRQCQKNSPIRDLGSCEIQKPSECETSETIEDKATDDRKSREATEPDDTFTKSEFKDYKSLNKNALIKYVQNMKMTLSRKEETLRKLQMAKTYRSKNDLNKLEQLIEKWRSVSQESLKDLHSAMPEPRPSLTELIDALQIDHKLIKYDSEDNDFL